MDYSVYLFDFDYTLANAEVGIMMCYRAVLQANEHPDVPDDTIRRGIGYGIVEIFTRLTGITDAETLERYKAEYLVASDEYMAENTVLYPYTVPVLTELRQRGKKIGIISTKHRYRIMQSLTRFGIEDMFDIIIGAEDVTELKPDPQGIMLAAEKLGAQNCDILYTGDSIVDARTANNACVDFAAVMTGTTTRAEFVTLPRLMIMSDLSALL